MQYEMCFLSGDIGPEFHPSTLVANTWHVMKRNVAVLEQARRQINTHPSLHLRNYGI